MKVEALYADQLPGLTSRERILSRRKKDAKFSLPESESPLEGGVPSAEDRSNARRTAFPDVSVES